MKNFFTSMFGALVALIIFTFGGVLLFFVLIGAIVAMGNQQNAQPVESGSYLVFDLEANITDSPPVVDLSAFTGGQIDTLQLRTVTRAIEGAAQDDRIAGILIKGALAPSGYGTGFAALKDVRTALEKFKASGKPVKAYLTFAQTKDYYLASVADEIVLDPYGMIFMPGLASQPMFFTGAFEKYGIGVQVTRVGKYKSFVEPYTRKDMSPENREQIQKLLNDIWGSLLADIAQSRGVTVEQIQATVDSEGIIRPEAAKTSKLVDTVEYRDEVIDDLKVKTGRKRPKEAFKQISLGNYAKASVDRLDAPKPGAKSPHGNRIAVVYAEGAIVDGDGEAGEVGGEKFSRELRSLRLDDDVKAIVLRVNSPGGSASASETIQRELRLAKKVKPVVVSMGSYAASGGYWIAAYSDKIFAEPTTITGSIGVFGIQFDVQKLANDFGITFDTVKTGKFADALTITRPKTEEEMAVMQRMVDWIYDQFTAKVAEARKLDHDFVKEIAQGRVWSGLEAKKLGLVDEIGGLEAAIEFAAAQAKMGDSYRVMEYPRKKDLGEAIAEMIERIQPNSTIRGNDVVTQVTERLKADLAALKSYNDPQGVYARMPIELSIR